MGTKDMVISDRLILPLFVVLTRLGEERLKASE